MKGEWLVCNWWKWEEGAAKQWVFLLSRAFLPFIFHNFAWEIPILLYFLINNLLIVIRGVRRRQTICVCPDVYYYHPSSSVCQFTESFIDFFDEQKSIKQSVKNHFHFPIHFCITVLHDKIGGKSFVAK